MTTSSATMPSNDNDESAEDLPNELFDDIENDFARWYTLSRDLMCVKP
jgi:hypothetical protein